MAKEQIKQFETFLKSHKAYTSFVKERKLYNENSPIGDYMKRIDHTRVMNSAFEWHKTIKGLIFWEALSIKWRQKILNAID